MIVYENEVVGEVTSWSRDFNDAYAETEDFTRIMDIMLSRALRNTPYQISRY